MFDFGMSELFLCGSKVILIVGQRKINSDGDLKKRTLSVFQLDLDEGRAYLVSTTPIELLNHFPLLRGGPHGVSAACHGDRIYIGDAFPLVVYNVATREWFICSLGETLRASEYYFGWRWAPITYQPILNPSLEV